MGLRGCSSEVSSSAESSHKSLTASRSRTISAKGLCGRRLRLRNSATAAWLVASQASRNPPRPLTATIFPSRSSARVWRMMPSEFCPGKRSFRTGFHQGQRRSTNGARIGLGMKAPVAGIFIFRLAISAHHEGRHGGGRAVIGYVADDGVARAAMGAIGEGISVAPVRGIAKITPASVASAGVGRDQSKFTRLLPAVKNREPFASLDCDFGDGDLGNLRQLREDLL